MDVLKKKDVFSMSVAYILVAVFIASTKQCRAGFCEKDNEENWSYHGSTNGPNQWPTLFPGCGGNKQSPIDIQTSHTKISPYLKQLSFFGYDYVVKQADVLNNGKTVMITTQDNVRRGITIDRRDYNLQELHFHWGSQQVPGSEHTLNKYRSEMEIHLVHRSYDNRTAVVGILVQMVNKDNRSFKPIVDVLMNVLYKNELTRLQSALNLNKILPEVPPSYYSYIGSLTTPNCTEDVLWFVLQDKQTIGKNQLASFLKIYSVDENDESKDCLLAPNNRPVQNLNDREVYESP